MSSTLLAQDCNNPLLAFFGLPGLESPESGADLPYCDGLRAADTCCSVDTVASFQDRANGIIAQLNNYAAAKDLYLAQLRNSYYDRFADILEDINEDHTDELASIRQANSTLADQLQGDIDSSNQARNEAREINNQFVGALDDYQTARTNCFTTALQVQSSAWCLACNPNYASEGVNDDGTVTISDGLCQAISDACWPFFNQSARFNPLIRAREAYWRLLAVSRYLNDYSATNSLTEFTVAQDPYNPLSTQQAVAVPEQWAGQEGSCLDLWSGDEQLTGLLTIGGVVVDANSGARLLQNALAGDAGVWEPDLTAAGLDLSQLRSDPGDFFGASDYSDYFNQTQNASDRTDGTDNDDHTDHDFN